MPGHMHRHMYRQACQVPLEWEQQRNLAAVPACCSFMLGFEEVQDLAWLISTRRAVLPLAACHAYQAAYHAPCDVAYRASRELLHTMNHTASHAIRRTGHHAPYRPDTGCHHLSPNVHLGCLEAPARLCHRPYRLYDPQHMRFHRPP